MSNNNYHTPSLQSKNAILDFIFSQSNTSRADIASHLHLSMPTTLSRVNELIEMGIIKESGRFSSSIGRKATIIEPVVNYRLVLGLNITNDRIEMVLLSLDGKPIASKRIKTLFNDSNEYYLKISKFLISFENESNIDKVPIIGVGIGIPGTISDDNMFILDSHVLNINHVECERISAHIPWPCYFLNDAIAGGFADLYSNNHLHTFVYFSLNFSISSAIFINDEVYCGLNRHSGEIGHFNVDPAGKRCYCGQNGCLECYCSPSYLVTLTPDRRISTFFKLVEVRDPAALAAWEDFLKYLSIAIVNVHMLLDSRITIGGYLSRWVEPWENEIKERVLSLNSYAPVCDYLSFSRIKQFNSAIGTGMYITKKYLKSI